MNAQRTGQPSRAQSVVAADRGTCTLGMDSRRDEVRATEPTVRRMRKRPTPRTRFRVVNTEHTKNRLITFYSEMERIPRGLLRGAVT